MTSLMFRIPYGHRALVEEASSRTMERGSLTDQNNSSSRIRLYRFGRRWQFPFLALARAAGRGIPRPGRPVESAAREANGEAQRRELLLKTLTLVALDLQGTALTAATRAAELLQHAQERIEVRFAPWQAGNCRRCLAAAPAPVTHDANHAIIGRRRTRGPDWPHLRRWFRPWLKNAPAIGGIDETRFAHFLALTERPTLRPISCRR